ncbi:MAG: hypothetical protein AB7I19_19275 [Planctomycetota bacterium]
MLFGNSLRAILARLESIDSRLAALEQRIEKLDEGQRLAEDLRIKREELTSLSAQTLHLIEMLGEARRRVRELEKGNKP